MNPDDLAMIPIYIGVDGEENAGLCSGTENCWAVNAKAAPEDIQATLDFMYWVVTSESGTKMLAEQFGPCPFKSAVEPENVFCAQAAEYAAEGKYTVTWAFNYTPNVDTWRAAVVAALTQYSVGGGSWDDVVTAFVNGWGHAVQQPVNILCGTGAGRPARPIPVDGWRKSSVNRNGITHHEPTTPYRAKEDAMEQTTLGRSVAALP